MCNNFLVCDPYEEPKDEGVIDVLRATFWLLYFAAMAIGSYTIFEALKSLNFGLFSLGR